MSSRRPSLAPRCTGGGRAGALQASAGCLVSAEIWLWPRVGVSRASTDGRHPVGRPVSRASTDGRHPVGPPSTDGRHPVGRPLPRTESAEFFCRDCIFLPEDVQVILRPVHSKHTYARVSPAWSAAIAQDNHPPNKLARKTTFAPPPWWFCSTAVRAVLPISSTSAISLRSSFTRVL